MAASDSSEFGSYGSLLRRRGVWIITIVPAAVLLAVYLAYSTPAKFRSTATIILERGSIAGDLIQSSVATSANQEIEIIQGRALTVEALQKLVKDFDPYPEQPGWSTERKAQQVLMDTSLERVDPVTGKPLEDSPAFSLYYMNPNPQRAAIVTHKLANLFLTYHQQLRQATARNAETLMQGRANELSKELAVLDEEYAQLAAKYGGTLPDGGARSGDGYYRAARDVDDAERQLRVAQERLSIAQIKLSSTSPNLMSSKAGDLMDLPAVKAQLAEAEQRYTADHPDVKRLRRALASLQAQQGSGGPVREADNPEYRRIAAEVSSARNEVEALQGTVSRARIQMSQQSATLNPSAELTTKAADVARRRQSLQAQFQDIQGRLRSAKLGQLVESDEFSERFSMVREPYPTSSPYVPNRAGLILMGLVLGSALAAIAVAVAESMDSTVRGLRDLGGYRNVPVLGSISEIMLPEDLRRRRRIWGSVSAAYLLLLVLVGISVVQTSIREHATVQDPANKVAKAAP